MSLHAPVRTRMDETGLGCGAVGTEVGVAWCERARE